MPIWTELAAGWRTLAILLGGVAVFFFVRVVVLAGLDRLAASTDNDVDDRLVHFVRKFFGIVLVFVVLLAVLDTWSIEVSPLLAGAGIAGIALGFAAKETLADVLAGIFLIADQPMRIGDRVKIEPIGREWGGWGDVLDIGLRRTRVRNTDGVVVNYPNNVLASSVITNFSDQQGPMRVRIRFAVGSTADLGEAIAVSSRAIAATEGILDDSVQIVVRSLWDESRGHAVAGILLEARYHIEDVRLRTRIRSRALIALQKALLASDVPLPSPTLQLTDGLRDGRAASRSPP